MKDITVSQNFAPLKPLCSVPLIRPLCVPLEVGTEFSEEISSHWKSGVYSLWERLGLVYLEEEKHKSMPTDNGIIVNNFTQQLIFQLFSQKNINRLIESNQPGFVLIDKVYREAASGRTSSGAKLSAVLEKHIAEKNALAHELEKVLVMASDGVPEHDTISVSEDMAALTVSTILRNVVAEKRITERQIAVSERILKRNTKQERTKALLKELSELVIEGGESSAVLTESILSRISEVLRTENSPAKSAFLRATAEKAAELTQQSYTEEQAIQVAKSIVGSVYRSEQVRREAEVFSRGAEAPNAAAVSSERRGAFVAEEDSGNGRQGLPTVGKILQEPDVKVSDAAMFLLEQSVEELDTRRGTALLGQLSAQEVRGLLKKSADRNAAELAKISGGSVEKAVSEAVTAALSMRNTAKASGRVSERISGAAAGGSGSAPGMTASLLRRAAGYVSDKLNYERDSSMSQISVAGGDNYAEYRLLERADRFVPASGTVGGSLSGSHYLVNNVSGVYYVVDAGAFDSGRADVQNVTNQNSVTNAGNVLNITANTVDQNYSETTVAGASKPVAGNYTDNHIDITYTENNSTDVQNVTNHDFVTNAGNVWNIAGNTVNQNYAETSAAGTAKPAVGNYTQNRADITYTENNSTDVQNVTNHNSVTNAGNVWNIAGNTVNQNYAETSAAGTAKPAVGNYTQNSADITYAENNSTDVQNVTNHNSVTNAGNVQNNTDNTVNQNYAETLATGAAKPAVGNYTQNNVDITYAENNVPSLNEHRWERSADITVKGHAEPYYGKRAARRRKAETAFGQDGQSPRHGRIIPVDDQPWYTISGSNKASGKSTEEVREDTATIVKDSEMSFRSDTEQDIFRSGQKNGRITGQNTVGSYRDKLDSKTLEVLDRVIRSAGKSDITGSRLAEAVHQKAVSLVAVPGEATVTDVELQFVEEESEQKNGTLVSVAALPHSVGGAEMRILLGQLRNAAKMKSPLIKQQKEVQHISRLMKSIEEQEAVRRGEITIAQSRYSFRTIDDIDNMIMLIPPVENDRFSAGSGYTRQLPPIEYKQPDKAQEEESSVKKPKTINTTQTTVQSVKAAVSGGFENMTREEINKLADMVYSQIQTRVMRERRRIGM